MSARILYVSRNDGTDIRVRKECRSLVRAGYDVHFVGWAAGAVEGAEHLSNAQTHFFPAQHSSNRIVNMVRLVGFSRYVARLIRTLRPDIVHCVNEELGMLAVLLQRVYGYRTVCDVFDSIALRWGNTPFPLNVLINQVAKHVHRWSHVLLVTDETRRRRLGPHVDKAWTVGNFPMDPGNDLARILPQRSGPIRLYVAGSLMIPRGLESIREILNRRDDVEVVSAGWLYDDFAEEFAQHPSVDFRGVITPDESLRAAASCHAVLALYEPTNENNVLASPNKIYDALCIGRPVVINREARVSEWVDEHRTGFVVPYGDVEALNDVVDALQESRLQMEQDAVRLRRLFDEGYSWSVAERQLLGAYGTLIKSSAMAA